MKNGSIPGGNWYAVFRQEEAGRLSESYLRAMPIRCFRMVNGLAEAVTAFDESVDETAPAFSHYEKIEKYRATVGTDTVLYRLAPSPWTFDLEHIAAYPGTVKASLAFDVFALVGI